MNAHLSSLFTMSECFVCQRSFSNTAGLNQHMAARCGRAQGFQPPPPGRQRSDSRSPSPRQAPAQRLSEGPRGGAPAQPAPGRAGNPAGDQNRVQGGNGEQERNDNFPGVYEGEQRRFLCNLILAVYEAKANLKRR